MFFSKIQWTRCIMRKKISFSVFIFSIILLRSSSASAENMRFFVPRLRITGPFSALTYNLPLRDEKAQFGGLDYSFGLDLEVIKYKNIAVLVDLKYVDCWMGSSGEDQGTESYGAGFLGTLKRYVALVELRYKYLGLAYGKRQYKGEYASWYDWWHDYQSSIAWDPRYAGYSEFNAYGLDIKGTEYGISFWKNASENYEHQFQISYISIEGFLKDTRLFLGKWVYSPKILKNGFYMNLEFGIGTKATLMEIECNIGYTFNLIPGRYKQN